MIIVTGDWTINDPSKRDEIIALMAETNALAQAMPGCITHEFYANLFDPNQIRLYVEHENYETELASEKDSRFDELAKRAFEYAQSGALTFEANLRRKELGAELPPLYGTDITSS